MSTSYLAALNEFRNRVVSGTHGYAYRYVNTKKWSWCTVGSPMAGPCDVALTNTNGEAPVYDSNGAYLRDSKGNVVTITDVTCIA